MDPNTDEGTVAKKIQHKRKSIQAAADAHAKANEERLNQVKNIQAAFAQIKDSPALADILQKCTDFQSYHVKLAQDGVGARKTGYKLEDGTQEVENFFLDNNQRAGHLDKCAGIQEIIDYIGRQLNPPKANPVTPPVTAPTKPAAKPVKTV